MLPPPFTGSSPAGKALLPQSTRGRPDSRLNANGSAVPTQPYLLLEGGKQGLTPDGTFTTKGHLAQMLVQTNHRRARVNVHKLLITSSLTSESV